MWGLLLSISLLRLNMNVYRFWVVFVCMASIWFKIAKHKFKEARSASFRIFQLEFGLLGFLVTCLGVGFFLAVTLHFWFFSFWLLAWLPRCVSNVKIFSKSPCIWRFPTNQNVTIKTIKLRNFLQKNPNPNLCNHHGLFDSLFDCLVTVFICLLY